LNNATHPSGTCALTPAANCSASISADTSHVASDIDKAACEALKCTYERVRGVTEVDRTEDCVAGYVPTYEVPDGQAGYQGDQACEKHLETGDECVDDDDNCIEVVTCWDRPYFDWARDRNGDYTTVKHIHRPLYANLCGGGQEGPLTGSLKSPEDPWDPLFADRDLEGPDGLTLCDAAQLLGGSADNWPPMGYERQTLESQEQYDIRTRNRPDDDLWLYQRRLDWFTKLANGWEGDEEQVRFHAASALGIYEMQKGDDGKCHYCRHEDLFIAVRNDIAMAQFYIVFILFFKSGRPEALKSAMMASFVFFMQTVQLLGKDTGYFMGKNFMEEVGNKKLKEQMAGVMEWIGSKIALDLAASQTVPVKMEDGVPVLQGEEMCPVHLNAFYKFYKNVIFKSLLVLIGVAFWHHVLYQLFVYTRMQYYVKQAATK
jgi:hypothetical protein